MHVNTHTHSSTVAMYVIVMGLEHIAAGVPNCPIQRCLPTSKELAFLTNVYAHYDYRLPW